AGSFLRPAVQELNPENSTRRWWRPCGKSGSIFPETRPRRFRISSNRAKRFLTSSRFATKRVRSVARYFRGTQLACIGGLLTLQVSKVRPQKNWQRPVRCGTPSKPRLKNGAVRFAESVPLDRSRPPG